MVMIHRLVSIKEDHTVYQCVRCSKQFSATPDGMNCRYDLALQMLLPACPDCELEEVPEKKN